MNPERVVVMLLLSGVSCSPSAHPVQAQRVEARAVRAQRAEARPVQSSASPDAHREPTPGRPLADYEVHDGSVNGPCFDFARSYCTRYEKCNAIDFKLEFGDRATKG